ncbi:mitochondrial distribution and morphology protein family 31/32 [Sistotremastrum niveocremeum HHB9708]|uniref:Mitochondrial distribution and morphology protein family 31/32 n=2 Tax=Sistotremastraceae TaxID=3402574 RepID=A0A164V7Z3_9AGAM|nr:mitochondrial distribution and morphology protein family 31/32 [Sistotremastrum niveocremeum HHB9708]KZT42397.1 mitochondrial distribution and morphology protein family 31/32 [Sistotremastrum suecicum HHB10207 ss-3]
MSSDRLLRRFLVDSLPHRHRPLCRCLPTSRTFHLSLSLRNESKKRPEPLDNYPRFFRRLALSLPHLHRPTRDDFLNITTGFWARARIRFKWFTIRSFRKFSADDMSAFVTWFLMSQTVWIFVGTTTFFSVMFATLNSLRLQEYVARSLSDYLTSETGITIIFESAIVPKWKESRISFKNVYVSRGHISPDTVDISQSSHSRAPDTTSTIPETKYSSFHLDVDSIDVTLSLWRWLDGRGLVQDAVVKGIRGVWDRRFVQWDSSLDPASFRHISQPGDFALESLRIEDLLITIFQPGQFRPYTMSVFRADVPALRKQWLCYDLLSAHSVVGQFDNCLFSLHHPQSFGKTAEKDFQKSDLKKSRFRIDGINIDHVKAMTTTDSPISWIRSGKVDAVLDIKFPRTPSEDVDFNALLNELASNISNAAAGQPLSDPDLLPGQRALAKPPLRAPPDNRQPLDNDASVHDIMSVDVDLRFRDIKAAVPLFPNQLSYVNSAMIRPIVAFLNANRTLVPIHCQVIRHLSDFDGSWTVTGLLDEITLKTYEALALHVTQSNLERRLQTVSLWSLQITAGAILSTVRNILDPAGVHIRNMYTDGL